MKYDVFISYSRKDYMDEQKNVIPGNVVSQVKDALMAAGITFWFDEQGIYHGQNFIKIITKNIEASKVFLFLSSVNSNQATWTSREIGIADERKKHIIPLRIDESLYNPEVEFRIVNLDYIVYYTNPKKGIAEMVDSIKKYLEQEREEEKKRLEEKRLKEEQERNKAEEMRRQKEEEEQRRIENQKRIINDIKIDCNKLNIEETKLLKERDNLLLRTENVSDTEKRAALKKEIIESSPFSQRLQEERLDLAKEIEDLKNDAERIKAEGTKNLQVKSQQIALLNERISEIEKERKGKNEQIAKLEKELTNTKNQKTPPKSIIQPATRRIHIVYILTILAVALISLFWFVKERRSIHNLEELLQAGKIELASYQQQAKQEEESRRQAEEEAKRKAEAEAKQQEEEAKRKAEAEAKQQEEESKRKAEVRAKQQADKGAKMQAEELNRLGDNYRYGRNGTSQSNEEAVRCYRKAAELGYAPAQYNLAGMYEDCLGVSNINNEHVKWYRKAAEQGYAPAQCQLGYIYSKGLGVTKSNNEAEKWYRKAAEQGNARAQCNLGYMYDTGQGVTKSYEEAVKWYRKAAEQGNASAQNNLGVMYKNGQGVTKSYEEAVKWYRKAAEQGNAYAQSNLGVMYENGQGVTKSDEEAVKWYRKAAEQGNEYAKKALEHLGK